MQSNIQILTNMAFFESAIWSAATTSICREGESPDALCPMRQVFRLVKQRRRFDAVVTMGPRVSLLYGLCCSLLGVSSRQIMTEVFLDAPRPSSWLWRMKTKLFRHVARRSCGVLTNSSGEIALIAERFHILENKLRFVPMYTTVKEPRLHEQNDGYVLSVGRTLRDLDTLFKAAAFISAPVIVVTDGHTRLPTSLPKNVQICCDISLDASRDLMRRCAMVVIPLLPVPRSTGQVVMFEAMAMGKPVIATRTVGTADYIRDGANGLLVAPGNAQALADSISQLLTDAVLARSLGAAALQDSQTRWTSDMHAQNKLAAIEAFWKTAGLFIREVAI